MVKARKYVLIKQFEGEPKESDFEIVEEELPDIKDGEILIQAEYLSVDPYMRVYVKQYKIPLDMIGRQVSKIIESRNKEFPVGNHVVAAVGWRTHAIIDPRVEVVQPVYLLPDLGNLPPSLGVGMLGMPGNSAYFGLTELCQPKAGETIVVTGAAGAVGSHVGQIGKILGCKVIGFAGTDEKCEWLTKELGFDYAFNYKTVNVKTALMEAAPNGVDCYFDNVGGEISSNIMNQMNRLGRVSVCGSISSYNDDVNTLPKASIVQPSLVFKELTLQGFLVNRWLNRRDEGILQNLKWIQEGKLKYRESVYQGFDNMYNAFVGMLRGENTGKAIVKV